MSESIEYRGYTIQIIQDESGENPITEWDGNVEFCCWHNRYDLGNSERFGNGTTFLLTRMENFTIFSVVDGLESQINKTARN